MKSDRAAAVDASPPYDGGCVTANAAALHPLIKASSARSLLAQRRPKKTPLKT